MNILLEISVCVQTTFAAETDLSEVNLCAVVNIKIRSLWLTQQEYIYTKSTKNGWGTEFG
jgi:hypothetical protein